ncbi:MAG: alpha/beta fold hydrolase [Jatrophihabitantaceae bacterium]
MSDADGAPGYRVRTRIGTMVGVAGAGSVHVRTDGPDGAPVLVLIHGFGGSMQWYDRVVPLLADTFRLIRIDLLGHGSTGGAAADAPVQAAAIDAVLAELDITRATAVGHSFGADVAVELAERSDRVDLLVILAQAPDYSDATLPRGRMLMTLPVVSTVLHRLAHHAAATLSRLVGLVRRPAAEFTVQAVSDLRALDVAMFRIVLVDRRDRMAARPLDAQLAATGKPTLVVLGAGDHFYGARSADRYRAAGAVVEVIADGTHSLPVELPTRTAGLIRTFVLASEHVDSPSRRSS